MKTDQTPEERTQQAEDLLGIKAAKRHKNKVTRLEVLRDVKENGCRRHRGVLIDHMTASAVLAVYEGIKRDDLKAKYEEIIEKDLLKAASIAWKLVKIG